MNRLGAGFAVLMAVAMAAPAAATASLQFSKVGLRAVDTGASITLGFQGVVDPDGSQTTAQFSNISGTVNYQLISVLNSGSGNAQTSTWRFLATLTNTSTAPMSSVRISTFGFSTAADQATGNNPAFLPISSFGVIGTPANLLFEQMLVSNSGLGIPNVAGSNSPQICLKDGGQTNNCAGGAGGGLGMNATANAGTLSNPFPTASSEFTIAFTGATTPAAITLTNFYLRFQSLTGTGNRVGGGTSNLNEDSGVGIVTNVGDLVDINGNPVPEPSSWAMLIAGFGLVGATLRRRRAVAA